MAKKKNRKNSPPEGPEISAHDCSYEKESASRGRFEERDSDRPDGVSGNYS